MGINRVIILGGGPVGLFCAIEASRHFNDVWIIEKRSAFTRPNVPQVSDQGLHDHLIKLDPYGKLPRPESLGSHFGPISQIEKTLLEQAVLRGVTMMRPYVVLSVQGDSPTSTQVSGHTLAQSGSEDNPHRYKRIRMIYQQWDDKNKKLDVRTRPHVLGGIDLLVVATGGGAIDDKLITDQLGFKYEKLKAKNYMAYGIFEPSKDLDDHSQKAEMENIYDEITGGASIAYETGKRKSVDLQYFLPSLAGITKTDFKNLTESKALLKRLLVTLKAGHGQSAGVLESIKEVDKNMLAFKIKIQRARQFYSPTFPAVLVGDAAVTPHPDSGSGLATGFRGFEELKILFEALKGTTSPKDEVVVYQSFNDRYELHVSKKALDGTKSIIQNLAHLLDRYASEVSRLGKIETNFHLAKEYNELAASIMKLANDLKTHESLATRLFNRLDKPSANELPDLAVDETAGKLWSGLAETYKKIKELTQNVTLLDGKIEAIEKLIAGK